MAARHSLENPLEYGFRRFEVETDNLKLSHHMKKGICENTIFGRIVADILKMVKTCSYFSFSHVCREGNEPMR